jgi:hypothetical protein
MKWLEMVDDLGNRDFISLSHVCRVNILHDLITLHVQGHEDSIWIYSLSREDAMEKYKDICRFSKETFVGDNKILRLESRPTRLKN